MSFGQAYPQQHQVKAAPRATSHLQVVATANRNQEYSLKKDKYFEIEMKVHDTELDKYGVVNNAIYSSYIRNGHDKLLESLGISVDSMVSKGSALLFQKFVVKVQLGQIKGVRLILEHKIETLPDHKLVLEAKGTLVCLDKDYHPTRIFPELSTKLLQFFSSKDE
ncbi:hypothetical protein ZWY2020_013655 [Hordeum vulgare]|nr:hypothetical protein ZWY2020_013655 [Hordeum vulgare]